MTTCTYNIELNPSDKVFSHWLTILTEAATAYNACCEFLVSNNVPLSIKPVHDNVYDWMRKTYPILPAQSIIKVYKDAMSSLKSIKSNKHKNAKIPAKHNLSMRLDKRLYGTLSKAGITLSNGESVKRELVPFKNLYLKAEEMFNLYTHDDPLLFFRDGKFYLSIPFEVPEKPMVSETACGVDLGVRQLFVTSEGKSFVDKGYLKKKREIRHKKRELQSKGTKSARRKLRKLKNRERNLTKDMCYRAAKALINSTDAGVLVLEDLKKMKQRTSKSKEGFKRKKHNNRMGQVPFAQFKEILSHKAPLAGKRVETVSPTYTSQTDSRSNKRDGERRGRRYICKDGLVLDADWNAAINIAQRSKHPLSSEIIPVNGGLAPLGGRSLSVDRLHCKPVKSSSHDGLASPPTLVVGN